MTKQEIIDKWKSKIALLEIESNDQAIHISLRTIANFKIATIYDCISDLIKLNDNSVPKAIVP